MKTRVLASIVLLLAIAIAFFGRQLFPPEPWVPAMEETGFEYLHASVAAAMEEIQRSANQEMPPDTNESSKCISKAQHELLKLKLYYIPATEVRQLIYDADRLYYLREKSRAKKKLHKANELLMKVGNSCGATVNKLTTDLILLVDELLINIESSSNGIQEQFETIGRQVNLMALKGELILAGVKFAAER